MSGITGCILNHNSVPVFAVFPTKTMFQVTANENKYSPITPVYMQQHLTVRTAVFALFHLFYIILRDKTSSLRWIQKQILLCSKNENILECIFIWYTFDEWSIGYFTINSSVQSVSQLIKK